MFFSLSARNKMRTRCTVNPYHDDHTPIQPTQTLQAFLTISHAPVFTGNHRRIEYRITQRQINAVLV
jgi:hypothetical protein